VAETVVWFLFDQAEATTFIYTPGVHPNAVCPELEPHVIDRSRKGDTLIDKPATNAETTCPRLDQEETELDRPVVDTYAHD
jgi:hypothetical protein